MEVKGVAAHLSNDNCTHSREIINSKNCLKRPLKNRQNKGLYGKW